VQPHRFGDLVADPHHRIERGHRLLKIIDIRFPRMPRILSSSSASRSVPSSVTEPPTILPGGSGTSRMIDSADTLLPQPDSPTIASVSPRRT
jgi:hypothetical protein